MKAMTLLKIAAGLAALYLVFVLLIAAVQDWLLFPRWLMASGAVSLPADAERVSIEVPDVGTLAGVVLPAERAPPEGSAPVLGFGGNAWDADLLAIYLRSLFPNRDIVTVHYRGYGPSAGRPSAEVILDDAELIFDEIIAPRDGDRTVVVGLSLGAGPAAHLASRRPVAGMILVTPFDSIEALAGDLYPWLPVRQLLRHRTRPDRPGPAYGGASARVRRSRSRPRHTGRRTQRHLRQQGFRPGDARRPCRHRGSERPRQMKGRLPNDATASRARGADACRSARGPRRRSRSSRDHTAEDVRPKR